MVTLLAISKRGDSYLSRLLIHGARSVICRAQQKADKCSWLHKLAERRNPDVPAVASANQPR